MNAGRHRSAVRFVFCRFSCFCPVRRPVSLRCFPRVPCDILEFHPPGKHQHQQQLERMNGRDSLEVVVGLVGGAQLAL